MRKLLPAAALMLTTSLGAALQAQTCLGAASFASGPIRLAGDLATATGVNSYGVSLAAGKPVGAFGSVGVARQEFGDLDASATLTSLTAGYAIAANPTGTVQVCPRVGFSIQSGPNFYDGFDSFTTSEHTLGLGLGIGDAIPISPTLDFVPAAAASFLTARGTVGLDGDKTAASSNYGQLDFAAGFVLSHRLTIQPAVSVPVGVNGANSSFQLMIGYNFR